MEELLARIGRDHRARLLALARFEREAYTRQLAYRGPGIELWLVSWLPGQGSTIHDHAGATTMNIVLAGSLIEERFERAAGGIVLAGTQRLDSDALDVLSAAAIHRVRVVGDHPAVTLHLYTPGYRIGRDYTTPEARCAT